MMLGWVRAFGCNERKRMKSDFTDFTLYTSGSAFSLIFFEVLPQSLFSSRLHRGFTVP